MKYSQDIVVFDLEASCSEQGNNEIHESNIIEIGAVRLDKKDLRIKSVFSELIKPRDFPVTEFITKITGITPEMVDNADTFDIVGKRFVDWYGPRNKALLSSFGVYYDMPLLRKEFQAFGLDFRSSFVGHALDIRAVATIWLAENNVDTRLVNVERTLDKMNVTLDLAWHRALDDAIAAAAILQYFHLNKVLVDLLAE